MKNRLAVLFLVLVSITFQPARLRAQESQSGHGQPEPPMAGIHWAKGQGPAGAGGAGSSPNMTSHGGPIMFTTETKAIFWGLNWNNSSFVSDKIDGLDSFYFGIGYSAYAVTSNDYTD